MKIRKIKRLFSKFFGFKDEKWARGGGKNGYGRCYGASKHGPNVDMRTRAEIRNDLDRKELKNLDKEFGND